MQRLPYIGVTGFTTRLQIVRALEWFPETTKRKLMAGVLTSSDLLHGREGKRPARFPDIDKIGRIFLCDPRVENIVHFRTNDREKIGDDLQELVGCLDHDLVDGFQLNVIWPNPRMIAFLTQRLDKRVVLHVGTQAIHAAQGVGVLEARIREYRDVITDVLIGGHGSSIDEELWRIVIDRVRSADSALGIGVAGGISAENVGSISLLREMPELSIDAQSKLRRADDTLDLDAMLSYLDAASFLTK